MPSTLQRDKSTGSPSHSSPPTRKKPARRKRRRGYLVFLLAGLVVLVAVISVGLVTANTTRDGRISASLKTFNFGTVKITGGLIKTRFPLTVEDGTVVVQKLGTT